ncbi:MAG: FG-GAP-like repeat-containing protein [Candidatus Poseidoniaceae archaeon]
MQETRVNKKTLILAALFLTPILFVPQSFASGTTHVSTFAGGAHSITVTSDGNNTSADLQLDLERNVTFQDASFVIESLSTSVSPGNVWINSSSGDTIWAFSDMGYGNLSHQNTFLSGWTYEVMPLNNSTAGPRFLIPKNASIQSSHANITYTPQIEAQYIPIGAVTAMELGDSNGDNLSDAFVLSLENLTTGVNTGFAVLESNQTSMQYNLTNWTQTCANSDRMRIADMNNDSHDDVVTFSNGSSMMCVHYYNTTTMTYDSYFNLNTTNNPLDVQIADIDGDGYPDFVTIHGPTNQGVVSVSPFSPPTKSARPGSDIVIYRWNDMVNRTDLATLRIDDFFNNNQTTIIVSDAWNDATEIVYDPQTRRLTENAQKFRNLSSESVAGDIDGDGDIDFITPKQFGSVIVLNNQSTWTQIPLPDTIVTTNATIADFKNNGEISLLTPNPQYEDGDPTTLDGDIGYRAISPTGLGSPNLSPLTPSSVPIDILLSDIDQDGLMDQFVLAGEEFHGIFIGAWHNLSLDVDGDGILDLSAEGYSSTSLPSIGVLNISDTNNVIKQTIEPMLLNLPSSVDGYGIEMTTNMMLISSNSNGIANFTDIDIIYNVDFTVRSCQGTIGSLSNSLNQQMLPGTGVFTITLPVETTRAGQLELSSVSMTYTLGAPNLALPPTPVLFAQSLTQSEAIIGWQNLSEFGSDIQEFQVFRMDSSTPFDFSSPYDVVTGQNFYSDSNVMAGSTYSYVVRSIHTFGVVSNLSQPFEVTIPYPPAPAAVTNVQLFDLDIETASAPMKVTWDGSTDSNVVEYRVYVAESDLDATGLNNELTPAKGYVIDGTTYQAVATVSSSVTEVEISSTSQYVDASGLTSSTAIQDGQQYWVAIAAIDSYDNATLPLPVAGPTTSFNNTYINSQLELTVSSGPDVVGDNVLESNSPLFVSMYAYYLDDMQQEVAIENAELEMAMTYGSDSFTLNGQSDSDGLWVAIDAQNLHDNIIPQSLLDYSATSGGVVSIDVSMEAIEVVDTQPYASAMASASMGTAITVDLAGPPESVDKDANNAIDINITLTATDSVNAAHQASLEGTTILWDAFDESLENATMSGSETISNGKIRITSSFANISRIDFTVDSGARLVFGTTSFSVFLNEYVVPVQENETNETVTEWAPTSIQTVTIACESATILTNNQSADDPIDCLVQNPNPFAVDVQTLILDDVKLFNTPAKIRIEANATGSISFVPKYGDRNWDRQSDVGVEKQITIELHTSSPDYEFPDEPFKLGHDVIWTADLFVEVQTNPDGEEKSSSNVILIGGIGAGVLILAAVGFVLYRKASADFEDEAFYEEQDEFLEEEDEPAEIPEGKPLDEFEDKAISAEPEIIERPGDSLISEVTESNADTFEEELRVEEDEPIEETEEDDGISVDEYGTEWYEDEVGTWWYREEGAEDWSEYNE